MGALILEMVGYRDRTPGAQIVPPFVGIDVPRSGEFLAAVGDAHFEFLAMVSEATAGAVERLLDGV
ncbi:MAG TPA: hypothetical protein VH137_01995 [Gemmatimonadales bacterium]|nr:hypothetical protein [Gemmatimonadales bacterium]